MGIFSTLRIVSGANQLAENPATGISSPWNSPNHLQSVVLADIFGTEDLLPVTRADAVRVPSISKARALVTGTGSRLPLRTMRKGEVAPEQPPWLYRTNSQVSPQQRMVWTIDDMMFHGWALWAVERGAGGKITDAVRVPTEWWRFTTEGTVEVTKEGVFAEVTADEVILFAGPQEGLVELAARAVRAYRDLEATRASRLRNPVASVVLHANEELNLEDSEVQELVDDYAESHNSSSLSVSYLPHNIDIEEHGTASPDLMLQAENAISVQIAQFTNVPATLLDASVEGGSSLTYQNSATEKSWFADTTMAYWLNPIEARLSMDDVTTRGTYVQFDTTSLTSVPTASPTLED